jgi:hypothetical protein
LIFFSKKKSQKKTPDQAFANCPVIQVENYAGLLVLRFLTGFFGSPCLANGGASVGDMVGIVPGDPGLFLTNSSTLS